MNSAASGVVARKRKNHGLKTALWAVAVPALGVVLFLTITSLRISQQANRDETRRAGAIIVFGAAEYSGRPSPVFRARLDHAYDLYKRGVAPIVITTGGAGDDPKYSEGQVGRDYLIQRGIPDANLIAETQSSDTSESAVRTATILRTNKIGTAVAVSDAYHVFRIKQMMKAQDFEVYGAPRPDSLPRTRWGKVEGLLREASSYLLWRLHIT